MAASVEQHRQSRADLTGTDETNVEGLRSGGHLVQLREGRRKVSDDCVFFAGDVAGITVMKRLGVIRTQRFRRVHHRHNRTAAACLYLFPLEECHQCILIEGPDLLDNFAIQSYRFIVRMIMGEVTARNKQEVSFATDAGQRFAQGQTVLSTLVPDHNRHKGKCSKRFLKERQLDFNRMLSAMTQLGKLQELRLTDQRLPYFMVNRNLSKRCEKTVARIDRDAAEVLAMARTNDDDCIILLSLQQPISGRGRRTGVHVACMRRDESSQNAVHRLFFRLVQEVGNTSAQLDRIGVIE